jgi:hypothetical protein
MADAKGKNEKASEPHGGHGHDGHGHGGGGGTNDVILLGKEGDGLFKIAAGLGVVGVVLSIVLGGGLQGAQFQHSYLAAFMWGLSICLGALWWVLMQHLVSARWSVVVRRIGELVSQGVVLMALLSLPIVVPMLMGSDVLYKWVSHEFMESNHALHTKLPYLNTGFFSVRWVVYFVLWALIARHFFKTSLKQDNSGDAKLSAKLKSISPVSMILFALTTTFAAVDFLMSLDPMWFSTIFGVYYFASCVLTFHAVLSITTMWLQRRGRLTTAVTVEHYHDIGKMQWAFNCFWTYIAFSQFMLIWYANIPEETVWFKDRLEGSWKGASYFLIAVHFVIPFFGMLSRHVKRSKPALSFWAWWTLAVVWFDMHWLVAPNLHHGGLSFSATDFTAALGVGGLLMAFVLWNAKKVPLLASKDPQLSRSLAFENI